MKFRLLGPLEVEREGVSVPIGAGKSRALLATLLLEADSVVAADRLIEALWGKRPPATATASLHNHVMRLRQQLGDVGAGISATDSRIRAVAPGYLIRIEPGELDLDEFAALCADGALAVRDSRWEQASRDLTAALSLWRGEPGADIPGLSERAEIRQLLEARLTAVEGRIEADLELGRHQAVLGELRTLTAEYPLREGFHGQLMLALYRAGQQAEALDVFQTLQDRLVDELGVEPCQSVRDLHRRLLDSDPELAALPPASRGGPCRQLPADTRSFTGREQELDELFAIARAAPEGTDAGMVVISAVDGMAGIGKTALAVHAAHRVRQQFPDGQLFVDLHGYTTELEPLSAGDALDWFLRSLGVPPQLIPQDLGARAAYYRDRLEGTRTLIVLDNASCAAQVRPLLPGGPGCLVLVTSRRRLAGLDDARSLSLSTLPTEDAAALLHKVAGLGRVPAHHPAVLELIDLCGRMPLAIRIAAARLRHQPDLRIDDVVAQLRDETARLGHLKDADRNLTAVFDLSYRDLDAAQQRLFRLLGLVPGPDFDARAAASLAAADRRSAEKLLESLLDHNLLTQHTPGRYRFHDLIRLYARALGGDDLAGAGEPLGRLLDYYQHAARAADLRITRHTRPAAQIEAAPLTTAIATAISTVPNLPDRSTALDWLRTERDNLLACGSYATAHGLRARLVALSCALATFLQQEGPWPLAATLHLTAATTAQELGDRLGEANALSDLARVRHMAGDLPAAVGLHERALAVFRELGDRLGEANALWDLGRVRLITAEYPLAGSLHEQALAIFQDLGDRLGEANALSDLGRVRYMVGDAQPAIGLLADGLAIYRELGHEQGAANALSGLGRIRRLNGDFPAAVDLHEQALAIFQDLGNSQGEANALWDLGRVQRMTGGYPVAIDLHERALTIYQDLGSRHGEALALLELGKVRYATGDFPAAASLHERALAIFQDLGNRLGEANVLCDLGQVRYATGDYPVAASLLEQSLAIFQDVGDRQGQAEVLGAIGALTVETGGPQEALAVYRQALGFAREAESRLDEAQALRGSAHCLARLDDRAAALSDLREAAAIYRRIGAAEAGRTAAELAEWEGEDRQLAG
jgi:DNA-binding SARP family transcriptional activator/tetratricopeptide (TPR) repeat protein